jgi:hypothetical protein
MSLSLEDRFDENQIHDRYGSLFEDDPFHESLDRFEEVYLSLDLRYDGVVDGLDFLHWASRHPKCKDKSIKDLRDMTEKFLAKYSSAGNGIVTWDDANLFRDDFVSTSFLN